MLRRRKSMGDRFRDLVPVLTLVAIGAVSVIGGMSILASSPPVAIRVKPTPTPSPAGPTFRSIPSYPIVTDPPVESQYPVASLPSSLPVVVVKHLSENDPAGVWAVSLAYPAFLNGSTPWSAEINQQIADIQRAEADHYEQGPAAARQAPGRTNHLTGTFGTELLTPSLASFTVIWSDDTTPGQTDLTVSTLTFDLSTGRPIVFDDMFADPDAALGIISVKAADLLYYQLGAAWDEALAQAGTTPNHANFANWSLTREGIKFIFNQYQVVNSEQIPSVVVPWADLMPVLSSRGAVAVYTGATALGSSPSPSSSVAASAGPSPSPSPTPSATDTASPSLPPVS